jgi:hypothetical protein
MHIADVFSDVILDLKCFSAKYLVAKLRYADYSCYSRRQVSDKQVVRELARGSLGNLTLDVHKCFKTSIDFALFAQSWSSGFGH